MSTTKRDPSDDDSSEELWYLLSEELDEPESAQVQYNAAVIKKSILDSDDLKALSLDTSEGLRDLRRNLRGRLFTLMRLSRGLHRAEPLPADAPQQARKSRASEIRDVQSIIGSIETYERANERRTASRYHARLAPRLCEIFRQPHEKRAQEIKTLLQKYNIPLNFAPLGQQRSAEEGLALLCWTDHQISTFSDPPSVEHAAKEALAQFFFGGVWKTIQNHEKEYDFLPPSKRLYLGPFYFEHRAKPADTLVSVLQRIFKWPVLEARRARTVHRKYHGTIGPTAPRVKQAPKRKGNRRHHNRDLGPPGPRGHGGAGRVR